MVRNTDLLDYFFLKGMDNDYYPTNLVGKGQEILTRLCERIEEEKPQTLEELYALTHEATEEFNDLAEEIYEAGSEFETVAREVTAGDFEVIAKAYGFDADREELVAPRDW